MGLRHAARDDPRLLSAGAAGFVGRSSAGSDASGEAMLVLIPADQRASTPAPSRQARAWILVLAGTGTFSGHQGELVLRTGHLIRLSPLSGPVVAGPRGLACLVVIADPTRPTAVNPQPRRRGAG